MRVLGEEVEFHTCASEPISLIILYMGYFDDIIKNDKFKIEGFDLAKCKLDSQITYIGNDISRIKAEDLTPGTIYMDSDGLMKMAYTPLPMPVKQKKEEKNDENLHIKVKKRKVSLNFKI